MAEADSLLDEGLDEEDRKLLGDVASPVAQSGDGPAPTDLDEVAPVGAAVAPVVSDAPDAVDALSPMSPTPMPGVTPPAPVAGAPDANGVVRQQEAVDVAKAEAQKATADEVARIAREADEDARLERADYLDRKKAAETDLAAKSKAYETERMVDPNTKRSTFKSTLARIFGGLGAAFRSAGGGDSNNHVLAQLQQGWENDYKLQQANIAALRDQAVMARTRLSDVEEGRRSMMRDADARLLAKYNTALKQGEAQLKAQGVPQAQIDADQRIAGLRQAAAAAKLRADKAADDHALNQARIESLKAKAARDKAKAAGRGKGSGGGGGPGATNAEALVAQHLIDNPGDIPGATRMAGDLNLDKKRLDKVIANTKAPEGSIKDARQAKIGLDAINAIEKQGYKPDRAEIQKWLNNSRLVHLADKDGVVGGIASLGQTFGAVPQSEVEGLSPQAAAYFGNVRRYMETIGRAQSGAAISPSEWTNFFNQYGPNSSGGTAAARQYLNDQFKVSGVAGRSLGAGQPTPAARPSAGQDSEAVQWAKKNLGDPRAKEILRLNGAR